MNKIITHILIVLVSLLIILLIGFFTWKYVYYDIDILFEDKKIVNIKNIVQKQNDNTQLFLEYAKNSTNTFENPKIIVDPYNVGFNSALIIFNTKEETEINLYINDEFIKTFESSTSHIIPIVNLDLNKDNKITLVTSEQTINNLTINTKNLISDYKLYTRLTNGNYLFVDSKNNIYEMNFLGKIYNAIYGIKNYSYFDNQLHIDTYNNKKITFLEDLSHYQETASDFKEDNLDSIIDYYNINFDTKEGNQYLFINQDVTELEIKDYIRDLSNASNDYSFSLNNDLLKLDTKSNNVYILLVNKDNIKKIKYNHYIKLDVDTQSALYVLEDNNYYDLGIVIK